MGKKSKEEKMGSQILSIIISAVIGAILGISGTLLTQHIQKEDMKKELHRKLFAEISQNSKQGQVMEFTGNFKNFDISVWRDFFGSPAFYDIPVEARRPLETYYLTLQWYNNEMLKWKQLDKKGENEMKMKTLTSLTQDYTKYLLEKKIIKPEQIFDKEDLQKVESKIDDDS